MNRSVISNCLSHLLAVFVIILCLSSWANAHSIDINPGVYTGLWAPPGGSFITGPASIDLPEGDNYPIQVGAIGVFYIDVDSNGVVSSDGVSATGGLGALTFNTTPLYVVRNDYKGYLSIGLGPVLGWPSTEISSIQIVPGLRYYFGVAYHSNFIINIDTTGNVTSENAAAAATSGNTLSLNTTTLNVDRNGYEGYLNIGLGPVLGWPSTEISSIQVVPGLSYSFGVALYSDFRINMDASGNVTSDNAAAATTSGNTLSLNTARLNVEANGYTGSWRIVNGPGPKTGSDSVLIVPGNPYVFTAGGVQTNINVVSDCLVDPSDILVDGVTLNLSIACAPQYSCSGFEPPMNNGPVTVKKNRALPLKAQLLDENGSQMTDADMVALPVLQVLYNSETGGDPIDVTDDALSAGQGTEGNQFVFTDEGKWQFNLKTKTYTAAGTYNITISTGDDSEYVIDPTCEASFIIK